jgi:hypothetical protein
MWSRKSSFIPDYLRQFRNDFALRSCRTNVPASVTMVLLFGVFAFAAGCTGRLNINKSAETLSEPAAGSDVAQAIMIAQMPLVTAAQKITDLDPDGVALGGIRLHVDRRAIELWWKGELPARVRQEIAVQTRNDIKIDVKPAKHSQQELNKAAQSIINNRGAYPGLVRVGPLADGSGLEVGLTGVSNAHSLRFPIDTKVVQEQMMTPLSRADDSPPYYAGAVTTAVAGPQPPRCTTGFAVARWAFIFEVDRGLVTAEHCFFGGDIDFVDGHFDRLGHAEPTPTGTNLKTDSLFIRTTAFSLASAGYTYDGGVVSSFAKPVVGVNRPFPGMFVCTSGAGTGVHCNIMVDSINNHNIFLVSTNFITHVEGVAVAREQSNGVAAGKGDSGGPVFTFAAQPGKVQATGMIVGGTDFLASCPPDQPVCHNTVFFVDISYVLSSHGVVLVTE